MQVQISNKLIFLCDTVPAKLRKLSPEQLSLKPSPEKWSKKQLLGHLIDSATNNHQRFVRAQFETPVVYYEQDLWVNLQHYQEEDIETIISLWEVYNRHLAYIIKHIPNKDLIKSTIGRDAKMYTLKFIVKDYLSHLEYHLEQIFAD
ncbi:MAG: DinB family protein [Pyrinomonadaceae bacterium]|nr:DinB family protein [Sphingobacteriaceae bacterium]